MEEIRELQRKLAAVQLENSSHKLSDRNVIDLVNKLQQLQKIEVVYTQNAKEFLTLKQLREEVEDEVLAQGGRVDVADIQSVINVDRSHVDKAAQEVARRNRDIELLDNELVSHWYLDGIMEDANELLQQSGKIGIGTLALQYGFPVDFMKECIQTRLKTIIQAQIKGADLFTESFVEMQSAQVRGVFSAITCPTFIPQVVSQYGFEEKVVDETLFNLIESGQLVGTIRGKEFVPHVFSENQKESMFSFFTQNGYLDNDRAYKLQVARPYEFLRKRFPDAIELDDCVVNGNFLCQIDGVVEVSIQEQSFTDIQPILPASISYSDMALLISKCSILKKRKQAVQIAGTFSCSRDFIDKCLDKFKTHAIAYATDYVESNRGNISATTNTNLIEDMYESENSSRKQKKKKLHDEDGELDKSERKGKKDKKGRSAKSRGGKKRETQNCDLGKSENDVSDDPIPTKNYQENLLICWFERLQNFPELAKGIIAEEENAITGLYKTSLETAMSSIKRGDAARNHQIRLKFEEAFNERYSWLVVVQKGLEKLEQLSTSLKDSESPGCSKEIDQHVLTSFCIPLTNLITSFVCQIYPSVPKEVFPNLIPILPDPETQENGEKEPSSMTVLLSEQKFALEKHLPSDISSAIIRLWTISSSSRQLVENYLIHLEKVSEVLQFPLRKLDRKSERQSLFGNRQDLFSQLRVTSTPLKILQLNLSLVFQKIFSLPLILSSTSLSILESLYGVLRLQIPTHMHNLYERGFSLIKEQSQDAASEEIEETLSIILEALREVGLAKDFNTIDLSEVSNKLKSYASM